MSWPSSSPRPRRPTNSPTAGGRPGDRTSRLWEERFGENRYLALGQDALARALKAAGLESGDIGRAGGDRHARACRLGAGEEARTGRVGRGRRPHLDRGPERHGAPAPGAGRSAGVDGFGGHPAGTTVVALHLADGADAVVLRTTEALASWRPARPVADQIANGAALPYSKFLAWRGQLQPEPPRRPEPARVSSTAAYRNEEWKFGFVGSKDRSSGAVHLPPSRISMEGGAVDDMEPVAMADAAGTVVTSTIDRLAYSPSPPIVFAVVDFDGGGRYPVELTDVDPDEIGAGSRVEMTFRRLFSADGIHDYFWKARPVPVPRAREEKPDGFARRVRQGRHRRHGLHEVRRAVGQGPRRPDRRCQHRGLRIGGRLQGRRRCLLVRHGTERHERDYTGPATAAAQQAGDTCRELLHDGLGGVARRGVRRGVGRLRRGHGGRGGEGQGQRVSGAQRHEPSGRRDGAHAHRGGDVLHGRAGLRAEVRRRRRDHGRCAGLHCGEEPPQRRA